MQAKFKILWDKILDIFVNNFGQIHCLLLKIIMTSAKFWWRNGVKIAKLIVYVCLGRYKVEDSGAFWLTDFS